IHIGPGRAFYT
nr:Chain P, HIV-1 JR-FL gp120 V3 peptide [Human immunodeficiency virus 1]4XMK_Q Chain Q, HIV-1 JR-FL gp120 V3 peptide [Human immunodeficiency virus 1]4XMK_R Chain R, HIV-1 JR-FL gp120 V3 peptide [Human immunodeficiency virus 1]